MRAAVLLLFVATGCMASGERPCSSGRCQLDDAGPAGWRDLAMNVWAYYGAFTGASAPAPELDRIHFIVVGDCASEPRLFQLRDGCWAGNTDVWTLPDGPHVGDTYVMEQLYLNPGILHHELLHAWLALSGLQEDGDSGHTRPEWTTLLPQAVQDVRQ